MDDTQRAVRQERNNEAEVEIPPEMGVSGFAGFLQMKSGLTVCERRNDISQQRVLEQEEAICGKGHP